MNALTQKHRIPHLPLEIPSQNMRNCVNLSDKTPPVPTLRMRTTLSAAAPFSGRPDSFPLTGPAQAAARHLPGRRERKAGRGKTSTVSNGAVWKNPREATQRAGKGYGGGKGMGGFAWGIVELVKQLDTLPFRVARYHSAAISGASHSTEVPEGESLMTRLWKERASESQHSLLESAGS